VQRFLFISVVCMRRGVGCLFSDAVLWLVESGCPALRVTYWTGAHLLCVLSVLWAVHSSRYLIGLVLPVIICCFASSFRSLAQMLPYNLTLQFLGSVFHFSAFAPAV